MIGEGYRGIYDSEHTIEHHRHFVSITDSRTVEVLKTYFLHESDLIFKTFNNMPKYCQNKRALCIYICCSQVLPQTNYVRHFAGNF